MKVRIVIDTGNAAFEDGYSEVARILADRASRIKRQESVEPSSLFDYNGNKVGELTVTGRKAIREGDAE